MKLSCHALSVGRWQNFHHGNVIQVQGQETKRELCFSGAVLIETYESMFALSLSA
jgi:hypothetical protein